MMESLMKGSAATNAIRKNYGLLHKAVTIGDIPMSLYSEGMIEENTFQQITTPGNGLTDADKGHLILKNVKKMVQIDPSRIELFCMILNSQEGAKKVASTLHGKLLCKSRLSAQSNLALICSIYIFEVNCGRDGRVSRWVFPFFLRSKLMVCYKYSYI